MVRGLFSGPTYPPAELCSAGGGPYKKKKRAVGFCVLTSAPFSFSGDTDSDDEDERIPELVMSNRISGNEKPIIFPHTYKGLEQASNLHV
jgi:hypothetical protein